MEMEKARASTETETRIEPLQRPMDRRMTMSIISVVIAERITRVSVESLYKVQRLIEMSLQERNG